MYVTRLINILLSMSYLMARFIRLILFLTLRMGGTRQIIIPSIISGFSSFHPFILIWNTLLVNFLYGKTIDVLSLH